MAAALNISLSTYSRRKDRDDFPTFDELRLLAERLGVDRTILHVDFGYLDVSEVSDELRQRYEDYRRAIDTITSLRKDPS
jgi:transcriptional regulator with XRE-family HTH domain